MSNEGFSSGTARGQAGARRLCACAALAALALGAVPARAAEPPLPAIPRVKPIPVKVIVVANFEPGADTGDAPGEFQPWAVANEGAGQLAAFEANYRVGAPVVHELLAHWDRYRDDVPSAPAPAAP